MKRRVLLTMTVVLAFSFVLQVPSAIAQESGQKTYASSQEAGKALYEAVKADDKAAMLIVLGQSASNIVSSGDEVQDKNNRDVFLKRYEQMNRWGQRKSTAIRRSTSARRTGHSLSR